MITREVDPCGQVGVAGAYRNNMAQNCITDVAAGQRYLEEQDCSATGGICVLFDGGATC